MDNYRTGIVVVLIWLQKQDNDEDKSWMAAGGEFQAEGSQTAKLCDPYSTSSGCNGSLTTVDGAAGMV